MTLWAVTMVKDELDVLPYTLTHLASEGVAGIIVADNLSTDGTWEWLQGAAQNLACGLVVQRDEDVGFYQSRKMTALVNAAFDHGADWVIPFDADELWFSARRVETLADSVARAASDVLVAPMHHHYPTSQDDLQEANPFKRILHRDPSRGVFPKVLVGRRPGIVIEQGNHGAHAEGAPPLTSQASDIEVAHFPWRSPEQYESKVRNGAAAYAATDLPEDMGAHWRHHGIILNERGPSELRVVYETWIRDPDIHLERKPAPWCRFA